MAISLKVTSENPDGSANAICDYDEEGEKLLVQEGITSILKQYIAQQGGNKVSGLWEVANKIDELSCRISNVKDIIELVAEKSQDPESGALWSARDQIEVLTDKLSEQSQALMDIKRAQMAQEMEVKSEVKPKKGAKK